MFGWVGRAYSPIKCEFGIYCNVWIGVTWECNVWVGVTHARAASSSDRQRVAVSDCVTQISDSVTELNRTLNELRHLKMGTFRWQMTNAMTWASTALTNGNACINGLINSSEVDDNLKVDVKRRVRDVSMLTSNALYLLC
ncbi:Pectinesterase inhibitor domain [Sesbania bispinosa]|nr:Pectinesterase inhibitor domain [Sesbania bispinosa]